MMMRTRLRAMLIALAVGGALVCASSAGAQVSTAHSGWFWGSPAPQGEPLTDVSFAGGVGYAVGDFGTVLRNLLLGTGTPASLSANAAAFASPRNGKYSLGVRIARKTAFVAQWAGDVTSSGAGSAAESTGVGRG
jgi:hypothetical protein